MPNKETNEKEILEKLEYIGLDLTNIPQAIKKDDCFDDITQKFYNEKQYRQYKFISTKDIQILISSANVSDSTEEKYRKARPIAEYLDVKNEKHNIFLKMLESVKIEDIKKIEEEQSKLNKKIPFKVEFENNYLWPIYYSESTDKYFMMVLEKSADYTTFFYMLKKQLAKRKVGKIFTPINNREYSGEYLNKKQFKSIEEYLWALTKDWPSVYEVTEKDGNISIQIVGETEIYGRIKSWYKIKLDNKEEANKFYKLLEVIGTLQKEFPNYYSIKTVINKIGELEFYFEEQKIDCNNLEEWVDQQYKISVKKRNTTNNMIAKQQETLKQEKLHSVSLEIEYLAKEKQITTFLQCKKSFFGKFKYFFKYGKNKNKSKKINKDNIVEIEKVESKEKIKINEKHKYNFKELLESYRQYEILENQNKELTIENKAILLKNRNLEKKLENATLYIKEIDSHKKSIFEFWKYSNKDEVDVLPEGKEKEVNVVKKVEKEFDYIEDFESLGKKQDRLQRKALSKEETDSAFVAKTEILEILNKIKNSEVLPKDISSSLRQVKKKLENEENTYDISNGKIRKNKESAKNEVSILDITKSTKTLGYKSTLENVLENIEKAISKTVATTNLPIYKALSEESMRRTDINLFNINPEDEIKQGLKTDKNKINFYRINLKEKTNALFYTNIIFFNNENKTLPIGMNLSSNVLLDLSKLELEIARNSNFKILQFENEQDDFSKTVIKTINVFEYDIK